MAVTRLNESQKSELVERFRAGETASDLAVVFGVSANTASRAVKAALDPDEYERIKKQQQRQRRSSGERSEVATAAVAPPPPEPQAEPEPDTPQATLQASHDTALLAIDDADDFSEDFGDDDVDDDEDAGDLHDPFRPVPVLEHVDDHALCEPQPLSGAALPASVYMLVDKTVELQALPLSEVPELGRLSDTEQQRQALVMYANPRQAKRLCGRNQRVIKVPDPGILERTAPYLLAQGISRVVIEGALYALPGG
ncbi:MAG: hypothetical protein ACK5E6_09980 [Cyanobacteriota bacterium]|jgi:hypothetical protein